MLDQTETTNNKLSFQKKNAKYYLKKIQLHVYVRFECIWVKVEAFQGEVFILILKKKNPTMRTPDTQQLFKNEFMETSSFFF